MIGVTAVAVGLMLWFFARSGRRHPVLPVALGLVARREHRQPDRPRSPRARDGLPRSRRVARVQPRRHVHRRRGGHPLRRARPRRPVAPNARRARWRRLRFTVAEEDAGSRLDRALAARDRDRVALARRAAPPGGRGPGRRRRPAEEPSPRSRLRGRGRASRGGRRCSSRSRLRFRVLLEDEHLVVVDKPAGLTVHPGAGARTDTLAAQLVTLGARGGYDPERPGIVHRLDRDTSGLLVAARSERAYAALQECDPPPRGRAPLPGARSRAPALAHGPYRRADRPRPPRPDEAFARHRRAARGGDPLRGASRRCPSTRSSTCAWRRAGRTRSAFIWRRSTFPCRAIPSTASAAISASSASSCTHTACASGTR